MEQLENEQPPPIIYPLQIPMESKIRYVSDPDVGVYHPYNAEEVKEKESNEDLQPVQSELHQTAEILCKLSDSPTLHLPPTSDPLSSLTDASRYTMHPVYPSRSFPNQGIISFPTQYPTFIAQQYPPIPSTMRTTTAVTDITLAPSISEEEWMTLTSPELPRQLSISTCGSPVVEEFLQAYLPPDTPAEDRQGWYEFLCEDGGNEDCWTKFLGGDSGAEFQPEWLEESGYQGGYQRDM